MQRKQQVILGIFPNMQKENVRYSLPHVIERCRALKITAVLPETLAGKYGTAALLEPRRTKSRRAGGKAKAAAGSRQDEEGLLSFVSLDALTAAVSLGGDGTFLQMARLLMPKKAPVFGVNFGHLGFLAEIEYGQLDQALTRLSRGDYLLEKRNLLQVEVRHADGKICRDLALNEFVLARGPMAKLAHLELAINGKRSGTYGADGIIMATATGSTAYSLSAGGPLVEPGLAVMVITPICAHALSARPLVIPLSETVTLQTLPPHEELLLTADGRTVCAVGSDARVTVVKSKQVLRFLKLTERSYYETWQEKLIRDF